MARSPGGVGNPRSLAASHHWAQDQDLQDNAAADEDSHVPHRHAVDEDDWLGKKVPGPVENVTACDRTLPPDDPGEQLAEGGAGGDSNALGAVPHGAPDEPGVCDLGLWHTGDSPDHRKP